MGAHGYAAGIAGHGSFTQSKGLDGWPPVEAPGHIPSTQPLFNRDTVVNNRSAYVPFTSCGHWC